MKRAILLVALAGCGVDLELPAETEVACRTDADCPDDRRCASRIGRCVSSIDEEAPRLLGVDVMARDQIRVVFSEPVSCVAVASPDAYAITPALGVTLAGGGSCTGPDDFTTSAVLYTEAQSPGAAYILTATAITDSGGNQLAEDGTTVPFNGFGQAPDPSPPDVLAPADGARVLGATQSLVWTTRPGADSYTVDVATDAGFASPISGSPFTVAAPATTLVLQGLSDVTHYWRVRSSLTASGQSLAVHDFDVLVDTVYVYCAGTGPCDETIVRNGSRTRPYASVQRALAAAAELSTSLDVANPTIKVAARTGAASYAGAVVVQWQSVRLLGGFDASFTTRSMNRDDTVLEAPSTILVVSNLPITVSTLIEGLTLRSTASGSTAVVVSAASGNFTMRNVAVRGEGSPTGLVRVSGGPSVGAQFDTCRFSTGVSSLGSTVLLELDNAAPTFRDSELQMDAGAHDQVTGVSVRGPLPGEATFDGFTLLVPAAAASSRGFLIEDAAANGPAVVIRNAVVSTGAADDTTAVQLENNAGVRIEHAHIAAGPITGSVPANAISNSFGSTGNIKLTVRDSIVEGPVCASLPCNALRIYRAASLVVTSSLVLSRGTGDGPPPILSAAALALSDTNPVLASTVLATTDDGARCIDVIAGGDYVTPIAMVHDVLLNCTGYRGKDSDGLDILANNDTELNALDGLPILTPDCPSGGPTCGQSRVQQTRRLADDPSATYADLDGGDGNPSTIGDNDYHLLGTANTFIRSGGLDSSATICAPLTQAASCGISDTDFYGAARTSAYAVGHDDLP